MGRKRIAGRKVGGDSGLLITPRRKGEKVPRKLMLLNGARLEVDIKERPMMNVIVDKIITEHKVENVFAHNTVLYDRALVHLERNAEMSYNIIDDAGIRFIKSLGENRLCMRLMNRSEINRLPKSDMLMNAPKVWYKAEPSIDLVDFYRRNDWKNFSWLYVNENIRKDRRLADWFKGVIVPLIPEVWANNAELSNLQFYNNNSFLLTNSQTGKSELARILGLIPTNEYTVAGLYGGTIKGVETRGELSGYGLSFFDECTFIKNYDDGLLIPQLLTYLSHGTASRSLKEGVKCRGTKTVVFSSNPPSSDDMLESIFQFLKILAGFEFPQKIGSRVGSVLISKIYERVTPTGALSTYRDATTRILDQTYRKYYFSRIYPILKSNMQWARSGLSDVENTYAKIAQSCPNELVKNFIIGLGLSVHKLKFSALRSVLFDEMDAIVIGFNKKDFQKEVVEQRREEVFQQLVSINLESLNEISLVEKSVESSEDFVRYVHKKFPNLSVRDIALFAGVPKSTCQDYLKSVAGDDEK